MFFVFEEVKADSESATSPSYKNGLFVSDREMAAGRTFKVQRRMVIDPQSTILGGRVRTALLKLCPLFDDTYSIRNLSVKSVYSDRRIISTKRVKKVVGLYIFFLQPTGTESIRN